MSMRPVELVSEWDTVPFDGGYEGLHSLSDQGFSGAVTAGPTQLFMLNGTVVGVLDGDIEAFDGAGGTARAAPHDALPLLAVMQNRTDGPRAQYYTEDTAISEVDRTLEDGSFTGYVELSENVLSGDYYLVYHQGRSMSVAWVGNSQRLVTDEDAFEQADGEVGIYQVMPADIEPVEIPEPAGSPAEESSGETAGTAAGSATAAAAADSEDDEWDGPDATASEATANPLDRSEPATSESSAGDTTGSELSETADTETASATAADIAERDTGAAGPPGSKAAGASQGTAVDRREEPDARAAETADATAAQTDTAAADAEPTGATETAEPTETEAEPVSNEVEPAESATTASEPAEPAESRTTRSETADPSTEPAAESSGTGGGSESQSAAAVTDSDAVGALETKSVPSLDPERSSSTPAEPTAKSQTASQSTTASQTPSQSQSSNASPATAESTETAATGSEAAGESTRSESAPSTGEERQPAPSPELKAELEEREAEIADLEGEIRELAAENEELAAERDRLLGELEEARAEIQRLEEELAAAGGAAPSGETLSPAAAIDGTNLFVRYHSKGEATLEKAQNGSADRAAVEENLRLEHHTQFDADETVVDGETFEAFLQDSIQYRFVDWLVRSLLYEIRDTGHESAMGVLYDALPKVDRAELNGKVSVTYTEDGQEHRSQETFDVVVRDRMGNPLVVANINDSRQPATEGQMTDIIQNAERVGNASDSLAAAFLVTSSFFEPEALETAREATSSGLFSRDKRKSFVNLSRKGGYHLCLLEARNREFHLAVPEL